MLSELNALTQSCASMTLHGGGRVSIAFTTENVSVAKRIFILLKKRLEINATPHFSKAARFGGRRICTIKLTQADTRKLMLSLHILHESEHGDVFRGLPENVANALSFAAFSLAKVPSVHQSIPPITWNLSATAKAEPKLYRRF